MDSSASTILRSRFESQAFIPFICQCIVERTKINKKEDGFGHNLKHNFSTRISETVQRWKAFALIDAWRWFTVKYRRRQNELSNTTCSHLFLQTPLLLLRWWNSCKISQSIHPHYLPLDISLTHLLPLTLKILTGLGQISFIFKFSVYTPNSMAS